MAPDASTNRPEARAVRPYSMLKLDFLVLLIPQHEVRGLEPADDIDTSEPPVNGVGWIRVGNQRCPVFCFSEQLRRLNEVPVTRRICAVLAVGEHVFGILCSEVAMLRLPEQRASAMPEAMILPGRPVHALALHEGTVMCVSSAARLIAHARGTSGNLH